MLSDRFRAAVEEGNVDQVPELFHEHAAFRSPVLFRPYEGRDQVLKVLRAAEQVLGIGGRFRYVHQLEDPHDRVAILEFATEVDGKHVEGIDKLTFDEDGLITELNGRQDPHARAFRHRLIRTPRARGHSCSRRKLLRVAIRRFIRRLRTASRPIDALSMFAKSTGGSYRNRLVRSERFRSSKSNDTSASH
jgi:hypothetical protein